MIKIRQILLVVLLLISISSLKAQYLSFSKDNNGTNPIVIPSGEVWQLLASGWQRVAGPPQDGILWCASTNTNSFIGKIAETYSISIRQGSGSEGAFFVGPTAVLFTPYVEKYFLLFKKIDGESSSSTSASPLVIPQFASGNIDVKLEQSADNVTWTECLPGTYNSSTVKRFFRLRAVEK